MTSPARVPIEDLLTTKLDHNRMPSDRAATTVEVPLSQASDRTGQRRRGLQVEGQLAACVISGFAVTAAHPLACRASPAELPSQPQG